MVLHPEAVKEEWLDKTPSSSKIWLSGQHKDVPKEHESNEITLNYNRVYGTMNKPRKRRASVFSRSRINGLRIMDHSAFTGDSIWRINFYSTFSML